MSDSYFSRLQWIKPDYPDGVVQAPNQVDQWSNLRRPAAVGQTRLATTLGQTLWTIGIPVGSTPEARCSPLLEARDLLHAACEIEHGLLVQYLYAAYSSTSLATRAKVVEIAREEMGH